MRSDIAGMISDLVVKGVRVQGRDIVISCKVGVWDNAEIDLSPSELASILKWSFTPKILLHVLRLLS